MIFNNEFDITHVFEQCIGYNQRYSAISEYHIFKPPMFGNPVEQNPSPAGG